MFAHMPTTAMLSSGALGSRKELCQKVMMPQHYTSVSFGRLLAWAGRRLRLKAAHFKSALHAIVGNSGIILATNLMQEQVSGRIYMHLYRRRDQGYGVEVTCLGALFGGPGPVARVAAHHTLYLYLQVLHLCAVRIGDEHRHQSTSGLNSVEKLVAAPPFLGVLALLVTSTDDLST